MTTKKFTELTRAELEVMQIIWAKRELFLSDIYEGFPEGDNRPAYTTISTFVRILTQKGFVGYKRCGKSHLYFPLVSKEDYTGKFMQGVMNNFFNNSPSQLLSFFCDSGKMSASQYDELRKIAEKILEK
ncbi:MecI family transcriptional regulator [Mucinivorans hirudinis]|uniref:MecI family transcriptional regulator n=1 Tax=Mucinivorans hirudinis TaxID=1433126 RepID=A0A060R886_9BACT|nr:MecI family transcriptional regulator [Mucinivorans hirudinis]